MKRSRIEAVKGWNRSSPERCRPSWTPSGEFLRLILGLNGVAIAVVLIAQWTLEKGIVLDQVSGAIVFSASILVWGLAIPVFLLMRAATWLEEWIMGRALARVAQPRPVRRASDSDLWDRWLDESPELFR